LIHPGLIPLHELVVDREISFYTMELVVGAELLHAARSEQALRHQFFQLCDVLAFLHSTGRVHRDVKPSNVLVREDGRLTLLDFGIGVDLNSPFSVRTGVAGTARYMAPEVMSLQEVTFAADSYSVGIILFEALTGR